MILFWPPKAAFNMIKHNGILVNDSLISLSFSALSWPDETVIHHLLNNGQIQNEILPSTQTPTGHSPCTPTHTKKPLPGSSLQFMTSYKAVEDSPFLMTVNICEHLLNCLYTLKPSKGGVGSFCLQVKILRSPATRSSPPVQGMEVACSPLYPHSLRNSSCYSLPGKVPVRINPPAFIPFSQHMSRIWNVTRRLLPSTLGLSFGTLYGLGFLSVLLISWSCKFLTLHSDGWRKWTLF